MNVDALWVRMVIGGQLDELEQTVRTAWRDGLELNCVDRCGDDVTLFFTPIRSRLDMSGVIGAIEKSRR
jgi:hypothetical protein